MLQETALPFEYNPLEVDFLLAIDPMDQLPDTRLSLIASLGNRENDVAWDEFLRIYQSAMMRYCQSRGLSYEDANEVVQDVCIAVHANAATWQPTGRSGSFRTWLFETARRLCLASLRKRKRTAMASLVSSLDVAASDPNGLEKAEADEWEAWAFCWACGQVQMSTQINTWKAFWMTAVEGQLPESVARELSMSIGAVYAAKCRILSRVRNAVFQLSEGDYHASS